MVIRGIDLIRKMEQYAPKRFAVEKDPIGLQVGDSNATVKGVLVCLDINGKVVEEAHDQGINWIVAHHPIIYRPIKSLRTDQPLGKVYSQLLRYDMNVYVAHTNLDVAENGVNDVLAERIGLTNTSVFLPVTHEKIKKLVVFVPASHHMQVLESIAQVGAGEIGNYSTCSFQVEGIGTFCPGEGTNPYCGKQGRLERANEIRLETIFKESDQERVIRAMLQTHPYEEVAYDVYPLEVKGEAFGLGRVGLLNEITTLEELARKMKEVYHLERLRVVGDPKKEVKKVAILGGSGGKFTLDAVGQEVDVYITGDIDYHTAQDAVAHGLAMIDPGHHVEHFVVDKVCEILRENFDGVEVVKSEINTNPFFFI